MFLEVAEVAETVKLLVLVCYSRAKFHVLKQSWKLRTTFIRQQVQVPLQLLLKSFNVDCFCLFLFEVKTIFKD